MAGDTSVQGSGQQGSGQQQSTGPAGRPTSPERSRAAARFSAALVLLVGAACGNRDETTVAGARRQERALSLVPEQASLSVPISPANVGETASSVEPPPSAPPLLLGPVGPGDSIFNRERRVEVQIELPASDWEKLSVEGIGMSEILFPASGQRQVPEYTHFLARVTVDGVTYEDVDIRKKGYIGSLSVIRPSLKLDFERGLGGPELVAGNRRMTLNNDVQDPSHVRQCLAFDLFAQLGLPAPRCSLAHVAVNGVDLGTYTNVEPIAKPMLRRFFDDASGNLYEGQLSDFNAATAAYLELETNEKENDRSDVQAVLSALALPDDRVLGALDPLVDLDAFFDFWALETLLGHWDGYSGNSNNYFAYHDPASGKFSFIPWGTDQVLVGDNPNDNLPYEIAVYAAGALSSRLYALPEQRARYRQRLGELLDTLWDVPRLLDQVEQLSRLALNSDRNGLARVRSYLRNHGESLRAALLEPAPEWPVAESPQPSDACTGTFGELSLAFSTVWGSLADNRSVAQMGSEPLPGRARIEGELFEGAFRGRAGDDGFVPGNANLRFFADQGDGFYIFADLTLPLELFTPGYHPWHSFESYGQFGLFQPDFGAFIPFAVIGDGGVQLERTSLEPGGAVVGSLTGKINYYACVSTIKGFFAPPPSPSPEPAGAEPAAAEPAAAEPAAAPPVAEPAPPQ